MSSQSNRREFVKAAVAGHLGAVATSPGTAVQPAAKDKADDPHPALEFPKAQKRMPKQSAARLREAAARKRLMWHARGNTG